MPRPDPSFSDPIETVSVVDRLADRIRSRILANEFAPGEALRQEAKELKGRLAAAEAHPAGGGDLFVSFKAGTSGFDSALDSQYKMVVAVHLLREGGNRGTDLYAQLTAERMQSIYEQMGGAGAISSQECAQAHIPFWF